ncbi:MYND-type domain-containing protein [Mycena kentingensis (nom. inval.)]|nr:MYND-type domain-containing protein [Mycena kentingensis (nom. inval.)]
MSALHPAAHSRTLQRLPLSRFAISAHRSEASLEIVKRAFEFLTQDADSPHRTAILPVVYVHLDPDKVPAVTDFVSGALSAADALAVAKAVSAWNALFGIFFSLPTAAGPCLWPRILAWATFFHAHRSTASPISTHFLELHRSFYYQLVGMTRSIYTSNPTFQNDILGAPELATLLGPAWAQYAATENDTELRFNIVVLEALCALVPEVAARSSTTLQDLAESVGGTKHDVAQFIARSIYAHSVLEQEKPDAWYTDQLLDFLGEMDGFPVCCHKNSSVDLPITPMLRTAIRHKLVYALIRVVNVISERSDDSAQETVNHCLLLALRAVLNSEVSILHEALEGGLIKALAVAVKWGEEPCVAKRVSMFVGLLPATLADPKTLALVNKGLIEVAPLTSWQSSFRQSYVGKDWEVLTVIARRWSHVLSQVVAPEYVAVGICDNLECGKIDERKAFRRCSGCLAFYYCSDACQVADWTRGGHRTSCALYNDFLLSENAASHPSYLGRSFIRALLHQFYIENLPHFYPQELICDPTTLGIPLISLQHLSRSFDPEKKELPTLEIRYMDIDAELEAAPATETAVADSESSASPSDTESDDASICSGHSRQHAPGRKTARVFTTGHPRVLGGRPAPVPASDPTRERGSLIHRWKVFARKHGSTGRPKTTRTRTRATRTRDPSRVGEPVVNTICARHPEWADILARARRSDGGFEVHVVQMTVHQHRGTSAGAEGLADQFWVVPLRRNEAGKRFRQRLRDELGSIRTGMGKKRFAAEVMRIRSECGDVVEVY